jgi:hypothetical protein
MFLPDMYSRVYRPTVSYLTSGHTAGISVVERDVPIDSVCLAHIVRMVHHPVMYLTKEAAFIGRSSPSTSTSCQSRTIPID